MEIRSSIPELPAPAARRALGGLPSSPGYTVEVRALRYRSRPHLSAWTDFDTRAIVLQIPEPFYSFGEVVPYAAKRRVGKGMRFIWLTEGVTFRRRRDVVRFLYLHEWMHARGTVDLPARGYTKPIGETACDRFALFNYRRSVVGVEDAEIALRWRVGDPRTAREANAAAAERPRIARA